MNVPGIGLIVDWHLRANAFASSIPPKDPERISSSTAHDTGVAPTARGVPDTINIVPSSSNNEIEAKPAFSLPARPSEAGASVERAAKLARMDEDVFLDLLDKYWREVKYV
jgi:hypothetical protein